MALVDFPLDHAVQITYNANGQEVSRVNVNSGTVKCGYEEYRGAEAVYHYTEATRYKFELWFQVPSDAYKYTCNSWSTLSNTSFDYVRHNYYGWFSTNPYSSNYWTQNSTGSRSIYNMGTATSRFQPADESINGKSNERIKFSEYDFHTMQNFDCDYIQMDVTGDVLELFSSSTSGSTTYLSSGTSLFTYDITDLKLTLDLTDIDINVDPVYPVDVYARNDSDLTVDWLWSNSVNRPQTYLNLVASNVTITDSEGNSIVYQIVGDDTDHVFTPEDLEALEIGQCTVTVDVLTNYGTTGQAIFVFELTGISDAPEITSVTQNSYPTISWDADNQICWEMQISDGYGIIFKTGMVSGSEQEYTVPKFLEDGGYSIEMRILNIYGILSAWGSYFLKLQPTKPNAPEGIIASARPDFGISVSCNEMETTGKLLAVRRKDENSTPVVLGEYKGSFVDYFVGLNDPHEYTIRNYVEGYADGDWIDGTSVASGVVIRDADNYSRFIHVWMSEDETTEYQKSEERSDVLMQCIGRKYPVAELGEWVTSSRSFRGYVTNEDFDKLIDMKLNSSHVLIQAKGEYLPCYMEFSDQGEYINNGRIVRFQMTRIDGEK